MTFLSFYSQCVSSICSNTFYCVAVFLLLQRGPYLYEKTVFSLPLDYFVTRIEARSKPFLGRFWYSNSRKEKEIRQQKRFKPPQLSPKLSLLTPSYRCCSALNRMKCFCRLSKIFFHFSGHTRLTSLFCSRLSYHFENRHAFERKHPFRPLVPQHQTFQQYKRLSCDCHC